MCRRQYTLLLVLVAATCFYGQARAGKLEDFERDATRDRSEDRRDDSGRDDPWGEDDYDYLPSGKAVHDPVDRFFSGMFSGLLIVPGQASWARAANDTPTLSQWNLAPRVPGDPFIPLIRMDAAYQAVESDVEALDGRLQLGYGPLAFEFNGTWFQEEDPSARLEIYHLYGLYRLSYGQNVEIDLGVGGIILDGEELNTGASLTIPFLVRIRDWLLVEFRPAWSEVNDTRIDKYELDVLFNWRSVALKTGYRWLESPNESLNGPFVGLSIRY